MPSQIEILATITFNPGLRASELAKLLGCPKKDIYMRLKQLRKYGLVAPKTVTVGPSEIYLWYATEREVEE